MPEVDAPSTPKMRKAKGRSLAVLRQAKELSDADYERAAEMLRCNGRFSVKGSRERLENALAHCKLMPAIEIARIAQDPTVSDELRLKALTFLGNKMLPDLKSVDMQVEERHDIQIVVKQFVRNIDVVSAAKPVIEASGE